LCTLILDNYGQLDLTNTRHNCAVVFLKSESQRASYTVGTEEPFSGGMRPEREANNSPQSSAEAKKKLRDNFTRCVCLRGVCKDKLTFNFIITQLISIFHKDTVASCVKIEVLNS
jgi:hypothetical protein